MDLTETMHKRVLLSLLRIGLKKRSPPVNKDPRLWKYSAVVDARLEDQVDNLVLALGVVFRHLLDVGVACLSVGGSDVLQAITMPSNVAEGWIIASAFGALFLLNESGFIELVISFDATCND